MADLTQYNDGAPMNGAGIAPREFGPLPAGEYPVEIRDACIKATKAGTGCYMELTLEILGSARKVWWRLTIQNPSQKATEIGKEQLNSVREAVGLVTLSDTDELIGKYMTVKLNVSGEYNEVKYCKVYEQAAQAAPAFAPSGPPTAPPAWSGAAVVAPANSTVPF